MLTESAQPERILGYHRLSAAEADGERLSEAERKKLPHFPVPCFRMDRLACRTDRRGQVLGKLLPGCAVDRCLQARKQVADCALIVDAKDELAKAFYLHFGFKSFQGTPVTLHLPPGRQRFWGRSTSRMNSCR